MLLTEEQTKYYLTDMINHYGEKKQDSVTSEAEYKQKALDILSEFPDSKAKQSLSELVEYTTERKI